MPRLPGPVAFLALALALAGCSAPGPDPGGQPSRIDLVDNRFQPASATVAAEQPAHFQNKGGRDHTVTVHDAAGHVLHDKVLKPGETDAYTFPAAGNYHVFCRFHNGMAAQVVAT